ncbi:MAG TPA: carboxypeptidase-like regulatory domain-containing protein [Blastocatellia bacterium]|nr:carboxypeptidase-like regulatory domain-containing protein [Blastocatellia bacterium]
MPHNLKLKWMAAGFLICNLIALAQNNKNLTRIYGYVTDTNEARVPSATVTLKNLATRQVLSTTTNEVGEFVFNAIKPGGYELSAEFLGSEKHTEGLQIQEGSEKEFKIILGPHQCPDPTKRLAEEEKAKPHYCSVHRRRLRVDVVPIEYGLVVLSSEDRRETFPNANWVYYGGCVVDCYKKAEILYCPVCRKAELKLRAK